MPPNYFQKPETALKRAQELISVGKEHDALDTLHDTIKVWGECGDRDHCFILWIIAGFEKDENRDFLHDSD
jgi:hypothetical protein